MKDIYLKFENWYRMTHWMSPEPALRLDGVTYEHEVVQAMFLAYRAGFNRARKEGKEKLRYEMECQRTLGKD